MHDVAVVGGGPSGGRLAGLLASSGLETVLYEEHAVVGEPCQCAGLVTSRVSDELGFRVPALNDLSGARVHGPAGRCLSFQADQPRAHAIDRAALDRAIVDRAVEAGAELARLSRVQSCRWTGEHVSYTVKANGQTHQDRARMIVGADGPASRVARDFGLHQAEDIVTAYGAELSGWAEEDPFVEVFIGHAMAPGFFGWVVPTGEGRARLGLAVAPGQGSARYHFRRLFEQYPTAAMFKDCRMGATLGGTIPLGLNPRPYGDGVVLVGDAAGCAKPTSGGGIYTGLVSARLAARTISSVLEQGRPTARTLAAYHQALKAEVGRELKRGMRLRRAYLKLSDEKLAQIMELLDDPAILEIIQRTGDIDYASRTAAAVLKHKPQLLKFAPLLLKPLV